MNAVHYIPADWKKIAIVGTCPSSRMLACGLPPDWRVWVCSPGNDDFPRIDLWFELHGDLDFPCEGGRWGKYIEWLNAAPFSLMAQRLDLFPNAEPFPIEKLVGEFGPCWFTSQPAMMLAYAIHIGVTDVALFGLDMAAKSEYFHQKPAMLHLAEEARRRGIRVVAPMESEVLTAPPIYGYSMNSPMGRKLRTRQLEIEQELRRMDNEIRLLEMRRQHFRGVLDDIDWTQQTWTGGLWTEDQEVTRVRGSQQQEA